MKFSFETPKKDGDKIMEIEGSPFGVEASFRLERGAPRGSFEFDKDNKLKLSATPGGIMEVINKVKYLNSPEMNKKFEPLNRRLNEYYEKQLRLSAERKKRAAEQTAKKYPEQEGKEEAELIKDIFNITK